jgi:hypothetical protein
MSLPSTVVYYNKDNVIVHKEYVNVGWSINEQIWLDCVNELPKVFDASIIECYGVKFSAKWVNCDQYRDYLIQLFRDREDAYFYKTKIINGVHYFNRVYGRNWYNKYKVEKLKDNFELSESSKVMLSMIRKAIPSMIAEDIVGVQPIAEASGMIFSMKKRYKSRNKLLRWFDVKTRTCQEQYRRAKIYLLSIIRAMT